MHPVKTLQIDILLLSAAVVVEYYAFTSSKIIGNLVRDNIFIAFCGPGGYTFYQQTIIRVEENNVRTPKHF